MVNSPENTSSPCQVTSARKSMASSATTRTNARSKKSSRREAERSSSVRSSGARTRPPVSAPRTDRGELWSATTLPGSRGCALPYPGRGVATPERRSASEVVRLVVAVVPRGVVAALLRRGLPDLAHGPGRAGHLVRHVVGEVTGRFARVGLHVGSSSPGGSGPCWPGRRGDHKGTRVVRGSARLAAGRVSRALGTGADDGADGVELGEEGEVEGPAQE